MYQVDHRDSVFELTDLPQSSVGAPLPLVLSNEHSSAVAFYVQESPEGWDGTAVRVVDYDSDEPWAIIVFRGCHAVMFGPPNDEAFYGHPLAQRGLGPYGAYLVRESSWLRSLERMNAVHSRHDKESFMEGKQHYILSFHDSTFECIAGNYRSVIGRGPLEDAVEQMKVLIQREA